MTKNEIIFYLIAFSGMYCHWFKKYAREQLSCSFIRYLITEPKNTFVTLITLLVSIITMQQSGIFLELTRETMSLVFMAGWTADSAFNKGE